MLYHQMLREKEILDKREKLFGRSYRHIRQVSLFIHRTVCTKNGMCLVKV